MKVAGALLAPRRSQQRATTAHLRHSLGQEDQEAYLTMLEEAEKRDHRRLGRQLDLFHLQDEAPG